MCDLLDIHAETQRLEQLGRHVDRIIEGGRAHHPAGRMVFDAQQQMPTALIRQGHAVSVELAVVELSLRLLELQILVFGTGRSPGVDL